MVCEFAHGVGWKGYSRTENVPIRGLQILDAAEDSMPSPCTMQIALTINFTKKTWHKLMENPETHHFANSHRHYNDFHDM